MAGGGGVGAMDIDGKDGGAAAAQTAGGAAAAADSSSTNGNATASGGNGGTGRDRTDSSSTRSGRRSRSSNPDPAGTVSYNAEHIIGNGSFGVVFQAVVVETGEVVAIKKVRGRPGSTRAGGVD